MDKYEFNIKVEQIKKMVSRGDYGTAMKIADYSGSAGKGYGRLLRHTDTC